MLQQFGVFTFLWTLFHVALFLYANLGLSVNAEPRISGSLSKWINTISLSTYSLVACAVMFSEVRAIFS